ncbi:cell division protein FtsZ [Alphaproteobacteria bacterium]|nr:cell division protein FtsZ [Alphaproteobacteria bacterium]
MINIKMQTTASENSGLTPKIAVLGIGGAGGNAVNNMISSNLEGCEFIVCNTDAQALDASLAETTIQLGAHVTGGLGAGSKPEIGKAAAEESMDEVLQYLEGANMAFVTAGMGGGTGTGAAPIIAKACRDMGILTVGVVTKPFHFEGSHRMKMAEEGIEKMQEYVDTLIVIPNQNLFRVANEKTTFAEAFRMADSVLQSGVRGVTDLMVRPGLVNLDFADIRTAMMEMGKAMMGTGESEGDKRAIEAAEAAINNPLLDDVSMKGAHGVIINVTGGYDMTLFEADEACNRIRDEVDPDANIIFGATFDESLEGKMRVSIVATGIEKESVKKSKPVGGAGKIGRTAAPVSAPAQFSPSAAPVAQEQSVAAASLQASRPVASQQPVVAPVNVDVPEADLFEQSQFSDRVASSETRSAQNTALRGTRYKNSFIPPKPIGGPASFHSYSAQVASQQPMSAAVPPATTHQTQEYLSSPAGYQAQPAPQHIKSQGLVLNPPKLPTAAVKPKTPSLFERISGTVQQGIEGLTGHGGSHSPRQRMEPAAPAVTSPAAAAPTAASQGSLNIDAPSAPKRSDEDLDIPAFLRRQAN